MSVLLHCPLCDGTHDHDHSAEAWAEWNERWDQMDYQPEEGPQPIVSSDGHSTRFYCTDPCRFHLNQRGGKEWLCANPSTPHVWERDAAYRWALIGVKE